MKFLQKIKNHWILGLCPIHNILIIVGIFCIILSLVSLKIKDINIRPKYPLLLSFFGVCLLILGFYLAGYFPQQPTPMTIKITNPSYDDIVTHFTVVKGTMSGSLPNDKYIWVVINPQNDTAWWPVERIVGYDGKWNVPTWIGSEGNNDIGVKFNILVIMVNESSNSNYRNYLDEASRTENYPGIHLVNDAIIYDQITVTRG